jgi:hypothetical protein
MLSTDIYSASPHLHNSAQLVYANYDKQKGRNNNHILVNMTKENREMGRWQCNSRRPKSAKKSKRVPIRFPRYAVVP